MSVPTNWPDLKRLLRTDLMSAMKSRRPHEVSAIRGLLAALANAEAHPPEKHNPQHGLGAGEVARREIDDGELRQIVQAEVGRYRSAIDELDSHGVDTATLRAELAVLERYRLRDPAPRR